MSSPKWVTYGGVRYPVTWGSGHESGQQVLLPTTTLPDEGPQQPYEKYTAVPPKKLGDPWTFVQALPSDEEVPLERQAACGLSRVE